MNSTESIDDIVDANGGTGLEEVNGLDCDRNGGGGGEGSSEAGLGPGDLRLYVKAGADGQRYGACPFCQRVFMILMLKSRRGRHQIRFKVATVNLSKPPEEFKQLGLRHVPALVHSDLIAYDNVDDIIQYVDEVFPDVELGYDDPLADNACKNVFSKFCFFIKEVSKDPANLLAELTKLDSFLERRNRALEGGSGQFVCGAQLTHLDCELLPKLQHLRVASAALKGLQLPVRLAAVWRYLHAAYANDIFVESCPPDQEIVLHWVDKSGTRNLTLEQHANLAKEAPKYSLDVPAIAQPVTIA